MCILAMIKSKEIITYNRDKVTIGDYVTYFDGRYFQKGKIYNITDIAYIIPDYVAMLYHRIYYIDRIPFKDILWKEERNDITWANKIIDNL